MITLPPSGMPLDLACVEFVCKATEKIIFDKYPGFILRSGFGAALKQLCIHKSQRIPCTQCRLQDECPYLYIFETPNTDPHSDFTAENFPHPFVFYPHITESCELDPGQVFRLGLTLFGKGIPYLLFYIYAFDLLGEMGLGRTRGRFTLLRVTDCSNAKTLYSNKDKTLTGQPEVLSLENFTTGTACNRVTIHFITPAKIEHNNRTVDYISPEIFIKRLLGRGSLLAKRHMDKSWHVDYHSMIDKFINTVGCESSRLKMNRLHRYSVRQRRSHPVYAVTGSAVFSGDLTSYMPLMTAGGLMHIGNGTSQGLGRYEIEN